MRRKRSGVNRGNSGVRQSCGGVRRKGSGVNLRSSGADRRSPGVRRWHADVRRKDSGAYDAVARLRGCAVARLRGCAVARLRGCAVARLRELTISSDVLGFISGSEDKGSRAGMRKFFFKLSFGGFHRLQSFHPRTIFQAGYFIPGMKPRPPVGADVRRRTGARLGPQRLLTSAPAMGVKCLGQACC